MVWFDDLKTPRIKSSDPQRNSKVPEGLWFKCTECGVVQQTKVMKENLMVCPECSHHYRLTAWERIALLSDEKVKNGKSSESQLIFEEIGTRLSSSDPLEFVDIKPYASRLRSSVEKSGSIEACVVGKASIEKLPYYLGVFEFKFMGGSMGAVAGEKLTLMMEAALEDQLPVVIVSSSGGARMQEGILSLMQMAKTSGLINAMRDQGLPYISILTDPTTGGVAASFSMLGDLILAEPKALIGFAGPRVIQQTIHQSLPEGFQRSEFLLEHGFVDRIVDRRQMRSELRSWLWALGRNVCRFPKNLSL